MGQLLIPIGQNNSHSLSEDTTWIHSRNSSILSNQHRMSLPDG